MSELPEADREGELPSPRETFELIGQESAQSTLFDAFMGGRMHHAWLLTGPKGVGKATLAYQLTRFVLKYGDRDTASAFKATSLFVPEDDPVSRQLVSLSHPDLLLLRRPADPKTKKLKSVIPVDEVRKTTKFFGQSSGAGGWRVCLVDSADEMNANAANALLKVLEEPPARALFILLSHQPGRLLPTIRSRCRQLPVPPLKGEAVNAILAQHGVTLEGTQAALIAELAEGSAGRALSISQGGGLELYQSMVQVISSLPRLDVPALHKLADIAGRRGANDKFATLMDLLTDWIARLIRVGAQKGAVQAVGLPGEAEMILEFARIAPLDRWVQVWEKINDLVGRAEAVNMDRKLVILNAFSLLERTVRGEAVGA